MRYIRERRRPDEVQGASMLDIWPKLNRPCSVDRERVISALHLGLLDGRVQSHHLEIVYVVLRFL
jgi:hypothetical protein